MDYWEDLKSSSGDSVIEWPKRQLYKWHQDAETDMLKTGTNITLKISVRPLYNPCYAVTTVAQLYYNSKRLSSVHLRLF